jgi:hypothetical protein
MDEVGHECQDDRVKDDMEIGVNRKGRTVSR